MHLHSGQNLKQVVQRDRPSCQPHTTLCKNSDLMHLQQNRLTDCTATCIKQLAEDKVKEDLGGSKPSYKSAKPASE